MVGRHLAHELILMDVRQKISLVGNVVLLLSTLTMFLVIKSVFHNFSLRSLEGNIESIFRHPEIYTMETLNS
jgi:hypothetical protein